ncbi:hypothetical protein AERO8C_80103 [Aeromonas veronii]|uniref:Uncharacterized protein n=1 Tax=Aeromonas veronii TaxID=654 RepID=A0A653LDH8_AERVE|nr:hypothetical protein AERO8C_80103 [Aeromonas veronii]
MNYIERIIPDISNFSMGKLK